MLMMPSLKPPCVVKQVQVAPQAPTLPATTSQKEQDLLDLNLELDRILSH